MGVVDDVLASPHGSRRGFLDGFPHVSRPRRSSPTGATLRRRRPRAGRAGRGESSHACRPPGVRAGAMLPSRPPASPDRPLRGVRYAVGRTRPDDAPEAVRHRLSMYATPGQVPCSRAGFAARNLHVNVDGLGTADGSSSGSALALHPAIWGEGMAVADLPVAPVGGHSTGQAGQPSRHAGRLRVQPATVVHRAARCPPGCAPTCGRPARRTTARPGVDVSFSASVVGAMTSSSQCAAVVEVDELELPVLLGWSRRIYDPGTAPRTTVSGDLDVVVPSSSRRRSKSHDVAHPTAATAPRAPSLRARTMTTSS